MATTRIKTQQIGDGQVQTADIADGAVTEAKQTLADNTTCNVSSSAHGYAPKNDNNAAHFLDGQGNYTAPTHANLSALSADDHTQYALLAGRSGGQTLIGDTASAGNLVLQSTAHATRGYVRSADRLLMSNEFSFFAAGDQLSADQNDYAPADIEKSTLLQLGCTSGADYNITGISTANMHANRLLYIAFSGGGSVTLKAQSSSSSLHNRFRMAADVVLKDAEGVGFYFDGNGWWHLTSFRADNLSAGTVPTARLGSGTANSSTFLRGDQAWATFAAAQSDQEAASSTALAVTPGTQQYHPSAVKGWVVFNGTGTISTLASYNVSSITDNGTGDWTVNWTTAFSSANYCVTFSGKYDEGVVTTCDSPQIGIKRVASNPAAGSVRVGCCIDGGSTAFDALRVCVAAFGDQ